MKPITLAFCVAVGWKTNLLGAWMPDVRVVAESKLVRVVEAIVPYQEFQADRVIDFFRGRHRESGGVVELVTVGTEEYLLPSRRRFEEPLYATRQWNDLSVFNSNRGPNNTLNLYGVATMISIDGAALAVVRKDQTAMQIILSGNEERLYFPAGKKRLRLHWIKFQQGPQYVQTPSTVAGHIVPQQGYDNGPRLELFLVADEGLPTPTDAIQLFKWFTKRFGDVAVMSIRTDSIFGDVRVPRVDWSITPLPSMGRSEWARKAYIACGLKIKGTCAVSSVADEERLGRLKWMETHGKK